MHSSQMAREFQASFEAKQPIMIWGPPGIGKSNVVEQFATNKKIAINDIRTILLDPVDLRGLPWVDKEKNKAMSAIPDFLPDPDDEGEGILFLDELTSAPKQVQGALYQLILDRKIGEYKLPDGWHIIAAGNRMTDRGVTTRMPTPLANRFYHIDMEVSFDDWMEWANNKNLGNITPEITSFMRFKPGSLHDFDPTSDAHAFPTPRSWEIMSKMSDGMDFERAKGIVGEGVAGEYLAFQRVWKSLPNPDAVIMNPTKAEVPKDMATLYALMGALANRASETNFDNVATYAARVPTEFQVILVRDAIQRDPNIVATPAFGKWADKNSKVLRSAA